MTLSSYYCSSISVGLRVSYLTLNMLLISWLRMFFDIILVRTIRSFSTINKLTNSLSNNQIPFTFVFLYEIGVCFSISFVLPIKSIYKHNTVNPFKLSSEFVNVIYSPWYYSINLSTSLYLIFRFKHKQFVNFEIFFTLWNKQDPLCNSVSNLFSVEFFTILK